MTKLVAVLMLGAGKLVQLAESFHAAARDEGVSLKLFSLELDAAVPISTVAEVIRGPHFTSREFDAALLQLVRERKVDLIVPNMDSATVELARLRAPLAALGATAIVSDYEVCRAMNDKIEADAWFSSADILVPPSGPLAAYPRIAKPRFGYASKGIARLESEEAEREFFATRDKSGYLVQQSIDGPEYTIDAYVDRNGRLIDALSRIRLEIEAGIVSRSLTHRHAGILHWTERILSRPGWAGPITLQFFASEPEPYVIEVNPRFGGGVTHAIACGLDMPRWILREHLGRPIEYVSRWRDGHVMARYRRDVYFEPRATA
jgi:carbamoyl-phosphate synthase large subunit